MTQHNERTFDRRQVLKVGGVVIGSCTLGSTAGSATGPPAAAGASGGPNTTGSQLINAEQTTDGAIVATDDDFVIAGQEIQINSQDFYDGSELPHPTARLTACA